MDTDLQFAEHAETDLPDEAMEEIFLARQPILDRQQKLVAYELLFRSYASEKADITEHMRATTTVIHNAFSGMGISAVLGHAQGHINVDSHFLMSDLVEALPAKQVVLEVPETIEIDAPLLERLGGLKKAGYIFALDGYTGNPQKVELLLQVVDIVKVDLLQIDSKILAETAADLRRRRLRLAAEKVETKEQFENACSLGFDLFQGYHFAKPQLLTKKHQKGIAKVQLLQLMSLIMGDADVGALESEFKRHPTLSYNLLRMVNSAAGGLRQRVNSLRHAIILMGRKQLQTWMQLLLYTAQDTGASSNPLMQMAATRGKLMETIAKADPASSKDDHDAAFMTGILSLIDALLGMPKEEIFKGLLISDEVRDALLFYKGGLGYILKLTETLEADNHLETKELIADVPGLSLERLLQMQLEAFFWANSIEKESE